MNRCLARGKDMVETHASGQWPRTAPADHSPGAALVLPWLCGCPQAPKLLERSEKRALTRRVILASPLQVTASPPTDVAGQSADETDMNAARDTCFCQKDGAHRRVRGRRWGRSDIRYIRDASEKAHHLQGHRSLSCLSRGGGSSSSSSSSGTTPAPRPRLLSRACDLVSGEAAV